MPSRSKAREQALQILFFIDTTGTSVAEAFKTYSSNFEHRDGDDLYTQKLVEGVVREQKTIDEWIENCSDNWRLSRIPRIDRTILRLGTFELLFCQDVPFSVALDEAIELGKRFGDTKTSSFINGILDQIAQQKKQKQNI